MKTILVVMFTSLFIHANLFSKMRTQVAEVVIYKVHPKTDLSIVTESVTKELKMYEGFISRETFQSVEDETILVDWVVWETQENAEQAATQVTENQHLLPFMNAIDTIQLFEYFEMNFFSGDKTSLQQKNILEVVIYSIKKEAAGQFSPVFTQVSNELKQIDGFKHRKSGVSVKNSNKFVDFLIWSNITAAHNSMEFVEKNKKIQPFFEMNDKTHFFLHCKILP